MLVLAVMLSGFAGLAWETLWQIEAGLALGVSARGTALTLVATMGGMSLGAAMMGRYLRRRPHARPGRLYAALEIVVALSGLAMLPGFRQIEALDGMVWRLSPSLAPVLHLVSMLALLGPPTLAMGATLPVFGALAPRWRFSIATLYAVNTAGAMLGVLVVSFVVLPAAGVRDTAAGMASLDLLVALVAWLVADRPGAPELAVATDGPEANDGDRGSLLIASLTGAVTFVLEVAWFRSLRATFQSSVDSFAIMLVAVLASLAAGAAVAPWVLRRFGRGAVPYLLAGAGILVLALTPAVERLDRWLPNVGHGYVFVIACRLGAALALLGPPVLLLGTVMPLLLARHREPAAQAAIYAVNTAGAIVGSVAAAWLLLPWVGATHTAWVAGLALVGCAALSSTGMGRRLVVGFAVAALAVAVAGRSGIGRLRVQSQTVEAGHRLLASHEGPDATVSTIELPNHDRVLVIDGFETTAETASAHYMAWMGRLPMLLHPNPGRGLVICFGTGQTAAALMDEGLPNLDVVELDPAVLSMASLFPSNHGVLAKPGVAVHTMDGRAWLRRTDVRYDVVTLEPMSPEFAGTNALYSVEFYERMRRVLNPGAVVAQWVPFHIVPPGAAVAIVGAFIYSFPDSLLWVDPRDGTGILVGREAGASTAIGQSWPGMSRHAGGRDLSTAEIMAGVWLGSAGLARYAALAPPVDDDNQSLAYGRLPAHRMRLGGGIVEVNHALVRRAGLSDVGNL